MSWDAKELKAEIEEKSRDLQVFVEARSLIQARVMEVSDSKCHLTPLPHWSGTDAVLGSLDLAIHAMERTLVELSTMYEQARPTLQLVKVEEE